MTSMKRLSLVSLFSVAICASLSACDDFLPDGGKDADSAGDAGSGTDGPDVPDKVPDSPKDPGSGSSSPGGPDAGVPGKSGAGSGEPPKSDDKEPDKKESEVPDVEDEASDDDDGGGSDKSEGSADVPPPDDSTTGDPDDPEPDPDEQECDETSPVTLHLSPDDSNSMSSPAQVKERLLVHGRAELRGVPLRPWEFFNYYDFGYPEPEGTVGATLELVPDSDEPGHYRLQIGVRSKTWTHESRPPMNLTLVLDTSGSMRGAPINMLRETVRAISSQLRAEDRLSVLTWSTTQNVLLDSHVIKAAGDPTVVQLIDTLEANGGTNLHAGLSKGYELAQKNYINDAINRVILVSDGGANVGVTSKELIAKHANDAGKDGIYLAGVGVGNESTYDDALMDTVTDVGKGASVFVHSKDEAQRIFADHFLSTLGIAAKNVQVQLDLPPGYELVSFSGEEASDDPTEVEPQHIGPNDSMVFHQEIKNCAPEIVDPNSKIKVTVRYQDALTHELGTEIVEATFAELAGSAGPNLGKGTALLYFTDALVASRDRKPDAAALLAKAKAKISAEVKSAPNDPQLKELLDQITVLAP